MIDRLTSPSLVSFLPHLMLLSSNSSLLASWGLMTERCLCHPNSIKIILCIQYKGCIKMPQQLKDTGEIKQSNDITIVRSQVLTHYHCQILSGA